MTGRNAVTVLLIWIIAILLGLIVPLPEETIDMDYRADGHIQYKEVSLTTDSTLTFYMPKNATILDGTISIEASFELRFNPCADKYNVVAGNGDINGDGYADFVAYDNIGQEQEFAVYLGSKSGYQSDPDLINPIEPIVNTVGGTSRYPGESADSDFNMHIDGDINADGRSDLILSFMEIGVNGLPDVGGIYIFLGASSGFNRTPDAHFNGTVCTHDIRSLKFGYSIDYAGDVNEDGYDDVVITHEKQLLTGAFISIIYGNRDCGALEVRSFYMVYLSAVPNYAAGVGDVDGDGYDDIGICYDYSTLVIKGSSSGLTNLNRTFLQNTLSFGRPASIDIDKDGYLDIYTMWPYTYAPDENTMYITRGPILAGTRTGPDITFLYETGRSVGYARVSTNIMGDEFPEFLLSVPQRIESSVFLPSDIAILSYQDEIIKKTQEPLFALPSAEGNDTWGKHMGIAGDPDGDEREDLWIDGAGATWGQTVIHLMHQEFPKNLTISINGRGIWTHPGNLDGPYEIGLADALMSAINSSDPLENGTVAINLELRFGNTGILRIKSFSISFISVESPRYFQATPLPEGNRILIEWLGNDDDSTRYDLYSNITGNWSIIASFPATEGSYVHGDLSDGRTYYYRFRSVRYPEEVVSEFGPFFYATPMDTKPPRIPENLTCRPILTGNELVISWDLVEDDCAGYELHSFINGSWSLIATLQKGQGLYTHTGLIDGLKYIYTITSFDEVPNRSPRSGNVSGIPSDSMPPSVPTRIEISARPEGKALFLQWVCDDTDVKGYRVYVLTKGDWTLLLETQTPHILLLNLTNGIQYEYSVTSLDEVPNESEKSMSFIGTPEDTFPPATPLNLRTLPGVYEGTIQLFWDSNNDDTEYYLIERRMIGGEYIEVGHVSRSWYTDENLTFDIQYYYRIIALDESGLRSLPSVVSSAFPRDMTAPPPPVLNDLPDLSNKDWIVVSGETEFNSIVDVLINGRSVASSVVGPETIFAITLENLTEGLLVVEALSRDRFNNTSPTSIAQWITIDTIPPSIISVEPNFNQTLLNEKYLFISFSEALSTLEIEIETLKDHSLQIGQFILVDNRTIAKIEIDNLLGRQRYILIITGSDPAGNIFNMSMPLETSDKEEQPGWPWLKAVGLGGILILIGLTIILVRREIS